MASLIKCPRISRGTTRAMDDACNATVTSTVMSTVGSAVQSTVNGKITRCECHAYHFDSMGSNRTRRATLRYKRDRAERASPSSSQNGRRNPVQYPLCLALIAKKRYASASEEATWAWTSPTIRYAVQAFDETAGFACLGYMRFGGIFVLWAL